MNRLTLALSLLLLHAGLDPVSVLGQQAATLTHTVLSPPTGTQSDAALGQSVAVSSQYTVAGAPQDDWAGQNSGVVKVFDSETGALLHVLVNPTPDPADQFGYAVALSGSRLVVGAHLDDTLGLNAGIAYVYDLAGPTPTLPIQVLQHPEPAVSDNFGFAVAISGARVAVSCHLDDVGATNAGTVLLFDLDSATPTVPTLVVANPSAALNDQFGYSVALSGTRLAVGTPLDDTGASNDGTVYVFDVAGTTPTVPVLTLANPHPAGQDQFGFTVAMAGHVLAVGVPSDDATATNAGRVYVYDFAGGYSTTASWVLDNPAPVAQDQFGYAVAVHGQKLVVGVPFDDLGAFDTGLAFVYDLAGATPTVPVASLTKETRLAEDKLGFAVGIWGDRVVAGVPSDDGGAINAGSVAVFDLAGVTPSVPIQLLSHGSPSAQDAFGAAVSISGQRMVVGAPRNSSGAASSGIAYVFDLAAANPTRAAWTFLPPEPGNGDEMGTSVAISGNWVAVGVSFADRDDVTDAGVVYVYDLSSATPTVPVAEIKNPEPQGSDRFGNAVALSGSRLLVGAKLDDALALNSGSAYVYDLAGATPTVPALILRNPTPAVGDGFGESVSLDGTLAVVGAAGDNTGATSAGSAYVYDLAGATPTVPMVTLNNPAPAASDAFGIAVGIHGVRVVVGAHLDDASATDSGSVYVYNLQSATPQLPVLTLGNPNPAASDQFGISVAISGAQVLVGAPLDDQGGTNTGIAYLFDLESEVPTVPAMILSHAPRVAQDNFGGAVALAGERAVVGAVGVDTVVWDKGAAFVFRASNTVEAVDIAVEQPAGTELLSGISTIAFGPVVLDQPGVERVFTLRNAGLEALTGLAVEMTGVHAADFAVVASPPATVAAGESATFTIRFTPTAGGPRSAGVHVLSNDPDESPFVITLSGTGVVPLPEIEIEQPVGVGLVSGQSTVSFGSVLAQAEWVERTFVVRNSGLAELTGIAIEKTGVHAGEFTLVTPPAGSVAVGESTSFTVRFTPLGGGDRLAMLRVASNDADENPFEIPLAGFGVVVPEIVVEQPVGTGLTNGAASVSFGEALVGEEAQDRVFTLRNVGTGDLTGVVVTVGGLHAGDLNLIASPAPVIPAGGSSSFTVRFQPLAGGLRAAELTVASNDPVNGAFVIGTTGTGLVQPHLQVQQPLGTPLTHEESTVSFGSVKVGGDAAHLTFALKNTGTADLTGIALSIVGPNAADYLVTSSPPETVGPGGSSSFTLRFLPAVPGESVAFLRIASNDPDHNPFEVELGGAGLPVPIIQVEQLANQPLVSDQGAVDFGVVPLGAEPVVLSFTLSNQGTGDLNLVSTTLSGPQAGAFSIAVQPLTTLDPGASTTFEVRFIPTAAGSQVAALTLVSNDEDRSPFVIHLVGQGVALPQLVVETLTGQTLPSVTGAVAFGAADVAGSPVERQLVLRNVGTAPLTGLAAAFAGLNAADFALTSALPTELEPNTSVNVTLRFTPQAGGARAAVLRLTGDDLDPAQYDLSLSGEGLVTPLLQIADHQDQTLLFGAAEVVFEAALTLRASSERSLMLRNVGTGELSQIAITFLGTHAGDFSLVDPVAEQLAVGEQQPARVRFSPSAGGLRTAVMQVTSNDPAHSPYLVALSGTGLVAPELVIEQPADQVLSSGQTSVAFGEGVLGESPQRRSFVLRNGGTAELSGIELSLSGANAADFTVVTAPPASLAAGQQTAFEVDFTPAAAGAREALLTVASNDPVNHPFLIPLTGSGLALPKLVVEQPIDSGLVNGTSLVGFGAALVRDGWADRSFTLRNLGTASLTITSLTLTGAAAQDYHLLEMPSSPLAPGEITTMLVRFAPTVGGDRNASLTLFSTDAAASPFVIPLNGFGTVVAEVVLEQPVGSPLISSLSTSISFGSVYLGGAPGSRTFQVKNVGTGDLTIASLTFSGVNAADFALQSALPTVLAAGQQATFTVLFSPAAAGNRVAAMRLFSNDPDTSPFELLVSGTGVATPDISVEFPVGTSLVSGFSSIDCGVMVLGEALVEREVTLRNVGTAPLSEMAIGVVGPHATDFGLDGFRDAPLSPGETFTFRVRFTASGEGARSATLQIFSNDPDESPFEIALLGSGLALPKLRVAMADGSPIQGGSALLQFGTVFVDAAPSEIQLHLRNDGAAPVTDLALTFEGDHPADFDLATPAISSLSPGASTDVTLRFAPTAGGSRAASLRITSNDAAASPLVVALVGFGNTPVLAFSAWAAQDYQLEGALALPEATPQNDGVANLLKYAFNMAADTPDSAILTPGIGTSGLPYISRITRRGGSYLRIEFVRRINSGLIYLPKMSESMAPTSWTGVSASPLISPINDEFERVIYEEFYDINVTRCLFGKVEVVLP